MKDKYLHSSADTDSENKDGKALIIRLFASVFLSVCGFIIGTKYPDHRIISLVLYIIAYLTAGYDVILKAVKNIFSGEIFDECFLMSIATVGAFLIGESPEAVSVMVLYQLGELLSDAACDRSNDSISALIGNAPDFARIISGKQEKIISPEDIKLGDTLIVLAGEKIPADGILCEGNVYLDVSSLTGESKPKYASVGDTVYSGSIVLDGKIKITVQKEYADSASAKIIRLTEKARENKSSTESFVTRFSKIYTPVVVALAFLISFLPPIFFGDLLSYIRRGLVFLVVSCPCALVLSVPIAYFASIGKASSKGILIKGGKFLDVLSNVKTAVFDKTGTLTTGVPTVSEIRCEKDIDPDFLKKIAYIGESFSGHPTAKAVCCASGTWDIPEDGVTDGKELAGRGTVCRYLGQRILCGSRALMLENGITLPPDDGDAAQSRVYVSCKDKYLGCFFLSDRIKDGSKNSVKELFSLGVKKCFMLTGDSASSAEKVAKETGLSGFRAELLPDKKAEALSEIKKTCGGNVLYAGDGINDAPVIALSDVGFSMGSLGSDAAIEASDIVIMDDDIAKIPECVRIAKMTRTVITENLVFILAVKLIILILSAIGFENMWLAVFADVGVTLLSVANSLRLLK